MTELYKVRVAAKRKVADNVVAFELASADSKPMRDFDAGAHVDVHIPGGPVRQYSLYAMPAEVARYNIAVLRDRASRGGSAALHDGVQVGDMLTISMPRNHFTLARGSRRSLLFAAGIGITPIMCMVDRLARDNQAFELHYSGRTLARMAFVDRLLVASYADKVRLHVSEGHVSQRLNARAAIGTPDDGTHLYVCGPTAYMDAVLEAARALGWNDAHLHHEYFAAAAVDHSGDAAFEIELARRGRVIRVAAGESAAQALLCAGVELSLSCEQGVCGTCVTPVMAGTPDHRDLYLMDDEHARNDCFTPCCSRSLSPRLVLDL